MINIAIFASGTGSNFEAIDKQIESGYLKAEIKLVVSDCLNAPVIEKAKQRNIEVFSFHPKEYQTKREYEKKIKEKCMALKIDYIVLAGYMRMIGEELLNAYPRKIINIHPSLLPSFKGKGAIEQALDYGVKVTGVTIHFIDQNMDEGEIIAQYPLNIEHKSKDEVIQAIHAIEHEFYSKTLKKIWEGGYEESTN